ncbi:MAG: hypothetical protein H7832_07280 [Magnetococcus sp. DMHC-6]
MTDLNFQKNHEFSEALVREAFAPAIGAAVRQAVQGHLRTFVSEQFPQMAEKMLRAEIARLEQQEGGVVVEERDLGQVVADVFGARIESIARAITRQLVAEQLPAIAERLVTEEIARIKQKALSPN